LIFRLSSTLSSANEIKVWRGYLFAEVNNYSTDDFIAVSIILAFALSLYFSWSHCLSFSCLKQCGRAECRDEEGPCQLLQKAKLLSATRRLDGRVKQSSRSPMALRCEFESAAASVILHQGGVCIER